MARVRVVLLSLLRDVVGSNQIDLYVEDGVTLNELLEELYNRYKELANMRKRLEIMVLVNGERKDRGYRLRDGDEVALMPPASGGI